MIIPLNIEFASRSPKNAAAAIGPARVYTSSVSLLSGPIAKRFAKKNKSVARTILTRGGRALEQLHEAIFAAFDRDDEHMYEFQMGKVSARQIQRAFQPREIARRLS